MELLSVRLHPEDTGHFQVRRSFDDPKSTSPQGQSKEVEPYHPCVDHRNGKGLGLGNGSELYVNPNDDGTDHERDVRPAEDTIPLP